MPLTARESVCLAVGATSTAVAVWLYRRHLLSPSEPSTPAPAARLPVLPAASLTDGAAAAAVRAAGVCVVHDALSAAELDELGQRLAALTPRKMQNRRPQRWEHVHDPAAEAFRRLAELPGIAAVVRALLGGKTYLEKAGMLVAHPGAEAQRWHMDTPHLFASRRAAQTLDRSHAEGRGLGELGWVEALV